MTGIWWVDILVGVILVYIILYGKICDDIPSTLEKAEVDMLEKMWKL